MPFVEPTTISYIALALAAIFDLPAFGRRVLASLRDLDDYRSNRPSDDRPVLRRGGDYGRGRSSGERKGAERA